MRRGRIPLIDRFEAKYIPEPNSGCWLWTAYCDVDGYGRLTKMPDENPHGKRWPYGAHHIAYELFCGPVPEGMQVLHQCDVPCCVNPDHLFLGTNASNMADKVAKGRQAQGALTCSSNKLTETQILAIRADPRQHKEIAADFGVSWSNVSMIKARKTWRHV